MLIVSWNVAGLSTTLQRINSDYGYNSAKVASKQGSSLASSSSGASSSSSRSSDKPRVQRSQFFADFMERHGADIFCVQEAKIPLAQLSSRSEPLGCSVVPGYESFWSCCVDASKRGFNGVATFARRGTVRSADASPLGERDLDEQGRCVMTDHGDFVLFNVYVPAGGGQPLAYKMRFLNALRRAMRTQREKFGRKVILVGDLNIAHKREDVHWKYRRVFVDKLLAELEECRANGSEASGVPKWKKDVLGHWEMISRALATKETVPVQTKNVATGATFDKFRVRVRRGDSGFILLGKAETTSEEALYSYDFTERLYVDEEVGKEIVVREENCVCLDVLAELMSKIAQVQWDEATVKSIASTSAGVSKTPPIDWLDEVTNEDSMCDTFRHFYPTAEGRFTCWHQYTNKRFENEGCRIDYSLVDKSLMEFVTKGDVSTLRVCNFDISCGDSLGEEAALHAATASGAFRGAGFEGNGIAAASKQALDTQFGPAHTGIIYTPPSYSDHIATSLLFCDSIKKCGEITLDEKDARTRKAQPHKSQQSISSFFGKKGSNGTISAKRKKGDCSENASKADAGKTAMKSFFRSTAGDVSNPQKAATKRAPNNLKTRSSKKAKKTGGSGEAMKTGAQKKERKGSIFHHFTKR